MEWKVRALDDDGNPIEPKQKEQPEVQEEPKEVDTNIGAEFGSSFDDFQDQK